MKNQRVQIQVQLKSVGLNVPKPICWITLARSACTAYLQSAQEERCKTGIKGRKICLNVPLNLFSQPQLSSRDCHKLYSQAFYQTKMRYFTMSILGRCSFSCDLFICDRFSFILFVCFTSICPEQPILQVLKKILYSHLHD